ncbi:coronin-2A isoform X2 [Canis lupus baileyi]|uniref:coronin-2A isoform X2 n=1 Tax=Canis lupus baileyi TaxID=143281 RepID=UPI003B97B31B
MAQGLGETWMILPCWPSRTVESRVQGWLDEGVAEGAVSGIGSRTLLGTKTGVVGVCKNSQRCDQTVQARDCRLHQQEHRLKSRKMSWHPQYRSSKFRHVFGKPASKENCYDSVPITHSVQDNHFCAVNPYFIAVVTECSCGGAFFVIPLHQTGKLDPHYPKVCGHKGNVLDIKWNPFNDFEIASCSEDTTVMVWNLDTKESVIMNPVRTIGCHQGVILSMSFNTNGSLLATTCKDRKIRILDPRAGAVLQEANCTGHRANKVLFLGDLNKLLSTGTSRWNNRQLAVWDQDNLSVPLSEVDLDGSSGVLFPFYDVDTNMLYVVGKGDGNIRYYEVSADKPHLSYLTEYRSLTPQKGIGIMPKRGLDVTSCEIFRFYKLITTKGLIEPISMIVPRRSESYQEDIYPPTAGAQPSLTAQEWLRGMNKGPVLVSLRPCSELLSPQPLLPERPPSEPTTPFNQKEKLVVEDGQKPFSRVEEKVPRQAAERRLEEKKTRLTNGFDIECPPPKTENELLQMFYRQQEEIRRLRELLTQREVQAKQLELEVKNSRMNSERF